jgi:hypothetical protein
LSTDTEIIWQGTVKVDASIIDHLTVINDRIDDFRLFHIADTKYNHEDIFQLDNFDGKTNFPNKVTLIVKGDLTEHMECFAIKCHILSESNSFIKKKFIKHTTLKGFILQPTTSVNEIDSSARLTAIRFDNEQSKVLNISNRGLVTFTSGSRTSNITIGSTRKSVTLFFISSDESPFVVSMGIKKPTLRITYGSIGILRKEHLENSQLITSQSSQTKLANEQSLEILNMRLSKGEITIEEYQKLKEILQCDSKKSSFYWV